MLKLYSIGNRFFFWNSHLTIGDYSIKMCLTYVCLLVCPLLFCIFESKAAVLMNLSEPPLFSIGSRAIKTRQLSLP
jgi:hypothetical protein